MKKAYIIGLILVAVIGVFSLWGSKSLSGNSDSSKYAQILKDGSDKVIIFKSIQCGCCGVYANYMRSKVGDRLTINQIDDINIIKDKYGIPINMRSCHTTVIGNYVIEGHIPTEAIDKLLAEKPSIKGIAMPGMPSGSPGMPGSKIGEFVIYALHNDGSTSEFMRI